MKNKLLITSLVISTLFFAVAYAAELIKAKEVSFSNGKSGLKASNVQSAIEELYNKNINDTSCKNVSAPKLGERLVPVTIDSDGTVTYANTSKEWYNYCDKRWANAVILEDNTNYKAGDTIQESDIESYFVWIPKYKYKLWNTGTASESVHEIDIVFDETDTIDVEGISCKTPMTSGESGNCDNGEYMTHPAFISMNTNGFWVGKYETGYRGATSVATAQVNANDTSKVIIKPNVYSWRSINIYNAFLASYNYQRNLDSHLMKNTEWGAVAYLSHSKYGINRKININNNSSYKTGYSANLETNQQVYPGTSGDGDSYNKPYNTKIGYLASTTGNISGIYDMSGGAWEYLAAHVNSYLSSSGFNTTTRNEYDNKYFDMYNDSSTTSSYQNMILGDATGEMGPFQYYNVNNTNMAHCWYSEINVFVSTAYPWALRSGNNSDGNQTGIFYIGGMTGEAVNRDGYRIVLTP